MAHCAGCGLAQLEHLVDPTELFADYPYRSSVSDRWLAHSKEHVQALVKEGRLGKGRTIVEIASNDGYLLQYAVPTGARVLGVEPAGNLAALARERGVPTREAFFGREVAEELAAEGLADVIVAKHVLAHAPRLNDFMAGIARLLSPTGIADLEFPWVGDLVAQCAFDTIYHEHVYYLSIAAVDELVTRHDLHLTDVTHFPSLHGGSVRLRVARTLSPAGRDRVDAWIHDEVERGLIDGSAWDDLAARVRALGHEVRRTLTRLSAEGCRIAAYGASAKGTTLLHTFGLGPRELAFVVDRSEAKQGRYTPGTHLPIREPAALVSEGIDVALLLTWNFADEIAAQQAAWLEQGGRFLVPVPTVRFLEAPCPTA